MGIFRRNPENYKEIEVGMRYGHSPDNFYVPQAETPEEAVSMASVDMMLFSGIHDDIYAAERLSEQEIARSKQADFESNLRSFGWREEWGEMPGYSGIQATQSQI